jgi:hypothetical protein
MLLSRKASSAGNQRISGSRIAWGESGKLGWSAIDELQDAVAELNEIIQAGNDDRFDNIVHTA